MSVRTKLKRGGVKDLRRIAANLGKLPKTIGQRVAADVSKDFSAATAAAYASGTTPYGDARPLGKHGPVTLKRTGKTEASLRFEAIGTTIRASFRTGWARFLVGRFRILPMGGLPVAWVKIAEGSAQRLAQSMLTEGR